VAANIYCLFRFMCQINFSFIHVCAVKFNVINKLFSMIFKTEILKNLFHTVTVNSDHV